MSEVIKSNKLTLQEFIKYTRLMKEVNDFCVKYTPEEMQAELSEEDKINFVNLSATLQADAYSIYSGYPSNNNPIPEEVQEIVNSVDLESSRVDLEVFVDLLNRVYEGETV